MTIGKLNILILFLVITFLGNAQEESIFTGIKSNHKKADEFYEKGEYLHALSIYKNLNKKKKSTPEIKLKLAKTFYHLNQKDKAIGLFEEFDSMDAFSIEDKEIFAESYVSLKDYSSALKIYENLSAGDFNSPYNARIWQVKNFKYLLEDSIHFGVNYMELNSSYTEGTPSIGKGELIFTSNQGDGGSIKVINPITNRPFAKSYAQKIDYDPLFLKRDLSRRKSKPAYRFINGKFKQGRIMFYNNFENAVYCKDIAYSKDKTESAIFFIKLENDTWVDNGIFKYNQDSVSLISPTINEAGDRMIFAANFKDSYGGLDLYESTFVNGEWTTPRNLGPKVNTTFDENHPYLHLNNDLYFSTKGWSGLGGTDIYKSKIAKGVYYDAVNMGYPINTNFDDFGLVLYDDGKEGFLVSNRKNGDFDDDIYHVTIDLQSYPLNVELSINYKDDNKGELKELKNTNIKLIDHYGSVLVQEKTTNDRGEVTVNIPFPSKFLIEIESEEIGKCTVVFEVPENEKQDLTHEIVVIKRIF